MLLLLPMPTSAAERGTESTDTFISLSQRSDRRSMDGLLVVSLCHWQCMAPVLPPHILTSSEAAMVVAVLNLRKVIIACVPESTGYKRSFIDHTGADDALLPTNWPGSGATERSVWSSCFPDL